MRLIRRCLRHWIPKFFQTLAHTQIPLSDKTSVRLATFLLIVPIHAQNLDPRQAMQLSIEKQKASVRKQVSSALPLADAPASSSSWFSQPWPKDSFPPITVPSHVPIDPIASAPCDPLPIDQTAPLIREAYLKHEMSEQLVRALIER